MTHRNLRVDTKVLACIMPTSYETPKGRLNDDAPGTILIEEINISPDPTMERAWPDRSATSRAFGIREIVDHITSYIVKPAQLAILALVNRDFCERARRALYTEIPFRGSYNDDLEQMMTAEYNITRASQIFERVLTTDALACQHTLVSP